MLLLFSPDQIQKVLQVQHLTVHLGKRLVLQDLNFELESGQVMALIGANGSGKTTLLRTLIGRVVSEGKILWMGKMIKDWSLRTLAKQVAYMPQSPLSEPGDRVIEVLRIGRFPHRGWMSLDHEEDEIMIRQVAKELGLTDLLDRPIETLSGGQRQRVFLGRCLVQSPRVILLDEPTTFLDLKHQAEFYRLMRQLAETRGICILMACHDLNLATAHADKVMVLKSGRILACGNVREVMTEQIISEAFDMRMKRIDLNDNFHFLPVE